MSNKNCKFCNKGDLHWETIGGKWALYDNKNEKHFCKPKSKMPEPKEGGFVYVLKKFKSDPLIDKAVNKFKKELKKK
jgi:hypothetical protein